MTRSGLYDYPASKDTSHPDMAISGTFSIIDMVSRLEPREFHWVESSLAEQEFLGWSLRELAQRSFLDVVVPEDRSRAEEALGQALLKGESLGLVVRIRTARATTRAIEVNAGARYGADHRVTYLRCHITDVTEKVRAERELRLRTRELTQVNEQLRKINRELEELKNRYTDLYDNAPAMYFSLDAQGRLIECNLTFLTTLGRDREALIGRGFEQFIAGSDLDHCHAMFAQLQKTGSIETESRWVKSSGDLIDVWISGKVIRGPKGKPDKTRCVAQDRTARLRLEAELKEKNQSLARANAELSLKNRELDEFVYVVSHDLQEPLRTLTAFSDFLLKDHASRLDREGGEYVLHLRDASRRMRSMIHGLLNLSRAGKVLDESGPVDLGELAQLVQADLRELIRSRGAEVRVSASGAILWGDRRRLHQLLANLVSNGIKYNRSQVPCVEIGALELTSHPHQPGSWLTFFVRDNGIGVEPRYHQRIFQLFRRLHSQDEFEGTGVGLAICNKIVQAHGGQICIDSIPGNGTTFYVWLPSGPATTLNILPPGSAAEDQSPAATAPGPGGEAVLSEP